MNINPELIKKMRIDLKLTQEKIAEKLGVSDKHYQRIEKGEKPINIWEFTTMMELVGFPTSDFWLLYLDTKEYEGYKLYQKTQKFFDTNRKEDSIKLLEELEKNPIANNKIVNKSIKHMRIFSDFYFCHDKKTVNYDEMISRLKETLGDINLYRIDQYHLTYAEIKILNHISAVYLQQGNDIEAIEILKQIVTNRKKFKISFQEEIEIIPLLLCNISSMLIQKEEFEEAYEYANQALKISNEVGASFELPEIYLNLAKCVNILEYDFEKVKTFLLRAFYCAEAIGRFSVAQTIFETAQKDFEIKL